MKLMLQYINQIHFLQANHKSFPYNKYNLFRPVLLYSLLLFHRIYRRNILFFQKNEPHIQIHRGLSCSSRLHNQLIIRLLPPLNRLEELFLLQEFARYCFCILLLINKSFLRWIFKRFPLNHR